MKKLILGLIICSAFLQIHAEDVTWLTSMPQAMAQAKVEKKLVLADFTGSDWCGWCKKMERETFTKPEFAAYARTNLVLVRLDYPHDMPQSEELKAANAALAERFKIDGYPTVILLKPDATALWRDNYVEGGPAALIAKLNAAKPK